MIFEGKIKISELKSHPKNNYYFDDMEGDSWDSLLQSISTSGVTNAITINEDKVIISGHQRVRACKVLGINEISYKMICYDDENKEIKDLIESNLRQRVLGNPNPIKMGRCFEFLNDYYGFQHGAKSFQGNQYVEVKENNFTSPNSDIPTNQTELAESYGITKQTMNNYMRMADMIPELDEMVRSQKVSKTTALAIMKQLSEEEQKELISTLPSDKKYTQKQMDEEIQKYKNRISELVQQKTKTEIVTQEVDRPETIKELERLQQQLAENIEKNQKLSQMIVEKEKMISQAIGISTNYQLTSHCSEITLKMLNFVKEMSQYDYMAESFNEIPNATRIEYEKCIKSVKKWADRILNTIYQTKDIIDN